MTGRVQYGPGVHAKAALAVCAHYLPVARAARLVAALTGVNVSAGFVAGIRGKAARLLRAVHEPGPGAAARRPGAVRRRDPRPRRREHCATCTWRAPSSSPRCTPATGPAKPSTPAASCPGYPGTIVRDGYKGYEHLTDALHAWCGAHGLRDLAGLYRFDPDGQVWARSMADLLIDASAPATAARTAGQASLSDASLARLRSWYRGAVAKGIADNQHKRTQIAKDGLRLARRFRDHEDMILRFATDLTVGFTSNQAERDIRPVKVQQRTSGGTWRTLLGLADFAIVQSYLSTAAKWGIDALDALTRLFTDGPWLPPATAPPSTAADRRPRHAHPPTSAPHVSRQSRVSAMKARLRLNSYPCCTSALQLRHGRPSSPPNPTPPCLHFAPSFSLPFIACASSPGPLSRSPDGDVTPPTTTGTPSP